MPENRNHKTSLIRVDVPNITIINSHNQCCLSLINIKFSLIYIERGTSTIEARISKKFKVKLNQKVTT